MKNLSLNQMENVEGGAYSGASCAVLAGVVAGGIVGAFFTGGWSLLGSAAAGTTYAENCGWVDSYLEGPAL